MAKDIDNLIKCLLVPCDNIWSNIALLLSAEEVVSDKAVLLPAWNDKYNLITLKSVPLTVGKKVIVFPIHGDKNNLVCHANPQLLFISGYVRDWDSKAVCCEQVDLISRQTVSVDTKPTGHYKFWALQGHDYVVQVHAPCFSPAQYSFPNISASQQHKSFYEIAVLGHVYHSDLTPINLEVISISGSKIDDTYTDENGLYVLKRVNRGDCRVEPNWPENFLPHYYDFLPISVKQVDKDFIERCGYTIKGYVFESDGVTPITDYEVFVTGDKEDSVLTDVDGLYTIPNHVPFHDLCIDKNYEVFPYKPWYFYPEKYTYAPLGGSKVDQNFVKGVTFYQTTRHEIHPDLWAWGNYWPGAGSFPIPGEDHVQKVRFGATVTLLEGTESPHLIGFTGRIHPTDEILWDIGGFTTVPETKHVEVFYLNYEPWMTPNGFYVSYWVNDQWHGYDDKNWDFHGEIEFLYEESPPIVETLEATNVTETSTTLNGKLHEVGWQECTVWFQWGEYPPTDETTHESFNLKWNFSAELSGLTPNTGYWFRVVVLSGETTYYANWMHFTTSTPPPPPVDYCNIICNTYPSGAEIYLNGNFVGTTPTTLVGIPAGECQITFRKAPNYINWDLKFTALSGKTNNVSAFIEQGQTAADFFAEIAGNTIDLNSIPERQCGGWCSANLDKWVKIAEWYFRMYGGDTNIRIYLNTLGGNPLPSSAYVKFYHEVAPYSYGIPWSVFQAALAALPTL